jgi:hypothetical protein
VRARGQAGQLWSVCSKCTHRAFLRQMRARLRRRCKYLRRLSLPVVVSVSRVLAIRRSCVHATATSTSTVQGAFDGRVCHHRPQKSLRKASKFRFARHLALWDRQLIEGVHDSSEVGAEQKGPRS